MRGIDLFEVVVRHSPARQGGIVEILQHDVTLSDQPILKMSLPSSEVQVERY